MTEEVVAVSTSKAGGRCQKCKGFIGKGGFVAKVSREGFTTKDGNGPGIWVCEPCSAGFEWSYDALPERMLTFKDFEPDVNVEYDEEARVPPGFIKALRYSEYTQLAYRLGYNNGRKHERMGH